MSSRAEIFIQNEQELLAGLRPPSERRCQNRVPGNLAPCNLPGQAGPIMRRTAKNLRLCAGDKIDRVCNFVGACARGTASLKVI